MRIRRLVATVALPLAIAALGAPAVAQEAIRIGTSSVGSVFYTIAVGAGEIIQKHAGVNTTVEPVGGSAANMRGLGAGKIEFALANAYASLTAFKGIEAFKEPIGGLRLVMQGQPSYRYLLIRKGSGVRTPKDLEGKILLGKRRALPEMEHVSNAYLDVFGADKSKVRIVETTDTPEALRAVRAGSVDAVIMPFSRRAPQVQEPMNEGVLEFLYLSRDQRDAILKRLPEAFWPDTFAPGEFDGQDKEVHIFGLSTYFVSRDKVPMDTVYKVAKALLDNNKEFTSYHRAAATWTLKNAVQSPSLPFHEGAIRYFKEKGVWTAELQAKQDQLLKK